MGSTNQNLRVISPLSKIEQGLVPASVLMGSNLSRAQVLEKSSIYDRFLQGAPGLPDGQYSICLRIIDKERVTIYSNCSSLNIQNKQALLLVYPYDNQSLDEKLPLFNWTSVYSGSNDVQYKIKWVEKSKAINSERKPKNLNAEVPFFKIHNVQTNHILYKLQFPAFDSNKEYYWQVEAYSNGNLLASSQVWEFDFSRKMKSAVMPKTFVQVNERTHSSIHFFTGSYLNFKWDNDYNFNKPSIKIQNENGVLVYENTDPDIFLRQPSGGTYFQIDVDGFLENNKHYSLFIEDEKRQYVINLKKLAL